MFKRDNKKVLIVDIIRKQGKIHRFNIAKITNLSPAGVGIIVDEMMKEGTLVQKSENVKIAKKLGFPLELNPEFSYSIGVEFDSNNIFSTVLDFTGREVISLKKTIEKGEDKFTIVKRIKEIIHQAIESAKIPSEKIGGICIGVPGFLDIERGVSVFYGLLLDWRDVSLKDMLSVEFSCPVYIEKNSSTIAFGEKWFGVAKEFENFVCIFIRSGIGMGIVINGKPFIGSNKNAGEFGHIIVDKSGPKCTCGNRGCIEQFASDSAIVREVQKLNPDLKDITIEKVIELAISNDKSTVDVLKESANVLSIAISMVINIISPKNIIILGKIAKVSNLIVPVIEETINHKAFSYPKDKTNLNIIFSEMKENIGALGAGMHVLGNFNDYKKSN